MLYPISLAALLVTALVVYRLQGVGLLLPMFGLIGACLGALVVVRPAIGLAAVVVSAAFVRVTIGTGTDSAIVASLLCAALLVIGWAGHRLLDRQRLWLLPRSIAAPAALLAGATLFSFLWGRLALDPRIAVPPTFYRVQIAQAALTLVSLGLLFVGADILKDRVLRSFLVITILGIGVVSLPFRAFTTAPSFINTAGLFGLWFISLAWSNALVNTHLPRWLRVALGGLAFGWLAMALTREASWVSGWLPAVLALLLITIIARPRLGVATTLLTIVGVAFYYSIVVNLLITRQEADGSLGGDFGRLELIQRNLSLIKDNLLLGTGPAGYALYYVTFFPDRAMSTHNNYVDILSQNGVAGLVGFVALLIGLGLTALRLIPRLTDAGDRAMTIAITGSVPALMLALWLGDWLVPFVYNQTIAGFDHAVYSWLMLAAIGGLYAQYARQANQDAPA
jgi:O-antigen ligase